MPFVKVIFDYFTRRRGPDAISRHPHKTPLLVALNKYLTRLHRVELIKTPARIPRAMFSFERVQILN